MHILTNDQHNIFKNPADTELVFIINKNAIYILRYIIFYG